MSDSPVSQSTADKPTRCRECRKRILVRRIRRAIGNLCPACKRTTANLNQQKYWLSQHDVHKQKQNARYATRKGKGRKSSAAGQTQSSAISLDNPTIHNG